MARNKCNVLSVTLYFVNSDNSLNSVPMTIPSKSPAFDEAKSANDLFEEFFNWRLNSSPEFATLLGIEGYDDKLGQEMNRNLSEIF